MWESKRPLYPVERKHAERQRQHHCDWTDRGRYQQGRGRGKRDSGERGQSSYVRLECEWQPGTTSHRNTERQRPIPRQRLSRLLHCRRLEDVHELNGRVLSRRHGWGAPVERHDVGDHGQYHDHWWLWLRKYQRQAHAG